MEFILYDLPHILPAVVSRIAIDRERRITQNHFAERPAFGQFDKPLAERIEPLVAAAFIRNGLILIRLTIMSSFSFTSSPEN